MTALVTATSGPLVALRVLVRAELPLSAGPDERDDAKEALFHRLADEVEALGLPRPTKRPADASLSSGWQRGDDALVCTMTHWAPAPDELVEHDEHGSCNVCVACAERIIEAAGARKR